MKKVIRCWQYCKKFLPASLLNLARLVYSPGYRMGQRAKRLRSRIETAWQQVAPKPTGLIVAGPFRGMRYIEKAVCSELPPKILGTYEMELHALIESIVARRPSCIIDIGAAEGFYAVGFATRLPNCMVVAFDQPRALRNC